MGPRRLRLDLLRLLDLSDVTGGVAALARAGSGVGGCRRCTPGHEPWLAPGAVPPPRCRVAPMLDLAGADHGGARADRIDGPRRCAGCGRGPFRRTGLTAGRS